MNRYAAIAAVGADHGDPAHLRGAGARPPGPRWRAKAMEASGIVPPDLPELEWGEIMGTAEMDAYDRIAATLELALAAGELKPGGRGWRLTQQRLARQQLTMPRATVRRCWTGSAPSGSTRGPTSVATGRRGLASAVLPDLLTDPAPPRDLGDRIAPMQWLLGARRGRARRSARDPADGDRQPGPSGRAGGGRALQLVGVARPAATVRIGHLASGRAASGAAAGRRAASVWPPACARHAWPDAAR